MTRSLLLEYAFKIRGFHRVTRWILDINVEDHECVKSVGFTKEGVERRAHFLDGTWVDRICYSILEDEYKA